MIFSFGFCFLSIFFASFIFSAAIFVFLSEYQTGILCPHQICLEIHQGSIFSIQYLNVLIHEDGKNFNSFFLIIFFTSLQSFLESTNHCVVIKGSIIDPLLSPIGTIILFLICFSRRFDFLRKSNINFLASYLSKPTKSLGTFSFS